MGYPMTFQRLKNRNRLHEGGYDNLGQAEPVFTWNLKGLGEIDALVDFPKADPPMDPERARDWYIQQIDRLKFEADTWAGRLRMFLGDLRRLEADAVDERSTCQYIAQRTGVDPETVAVVLKEFMSW